jgi:hypothetical protein
MPAPYEVLRYEGDFYFDRINENGTFTQVLDRPVEMTAVGFAFEEGEERTVVSKGLGRYNQPIYSERDPGASNLNLTALEFPPDFKALLFAATITQAPVTGATITGETYVSQGPGSIIRLAHGAIAAGAVTCVDNATPTPNSYTEGDDFVVNRTFGTVTIPEGSTIVAGTTLIFGYTHGNYTATTFVGGLKPQQRFRVRAFVRNRPTGNFEFLEIFDVNLARGGDTNLLDENALTLELSGVMLTPPGQPGPFRVTDRRASA